MKFIMPVELTFETDTAVRYTVVQRNGIDWIGWVKKTELRPPVNFDVWDLRTRFLKLEADPQSFAIFFTEAKVPPEFYNRTFDHWLDWQQALKILMKTPPGRWRLLADRYAHKGVREALEHAAYESGTEAGFQWKNDDLPHLCIGCYDLIDAMVVSICVDYARGAKYRWCKEPSCGAPFLVESSRQIYCSRECLHRAVVRRSRERTRLAKRNKDRTRHGGSFRRGTGRG